MQLISACEYNLYCNFFLSSSDILRRPQKIGLFSIFHYLGVSNCMRKMGQIFVAFSEYLNFNAQFITFFGQFVVADGNLKGLSSSCTDEIWVFKAFHNFFYKAKVIFSFHEQMHYVHSGGIFV